MVEKYDIQIKMSDNTIHINLNIQTNLFRYLGNNLSMMDINLQIKNKT